MTVLRPHYLAVLICLVLASGGPATAEDQVVGATARVVNDISGVLDQRVRTIALDDSVYFDETIESGVDSATEIVFKDGTRLRMGPLSRITLNAVVFDPDPQKSRFAANLEEGVFEFASGLLPKDKYRFETPTGTIGIRGTKFTVVVLSPRIADWLAQRQGD